jgi:chromosome segregation ATPase
MKAAFILLIVCTVGLGVGLLVVHNKRVKIEQARNETAENLTNTIQRLETTRQKLEEQEQVTIQLETNLFLRGQELSSVSNNYMKISAELAKTQKEMQVAVEHARQEIERKDAQIAQLTSQTNALSRKMDDLTSSIGSLSKQIADTEKKLLASEGDREFLLKELKRLQTEIQRSVGFAHPGGQAEGRTLGGAAAGMDSHGHLWEPGKERGRKTARRSHAWEHE